MEKISKALEGKKTYIGITISLLGLLGLGSLVTGGELESALDAVMQIVGLAVAVYGRYKALPKKKVASKKK